MTSSAPWRLSRLAPTAERWPERNRQPPPRKVRAYSPAEIEAIAPAEIEAIAAELPAAHRPLPAFVAATGLRPEEWQALERRDVDRSSRTMNVRRTISGGEIVELAKTSGGRR